MTLRLILAAALALAAVPAMAEELAVRVRDADGAPLPDAVVQLIPAGGAAAGGAGPARTHLVDQTNEEFLPLVTLAQPGDSVTFRNSDSTLHHVYSFAPIAAFEMLVPSGETSAPVTYSEAGVAAVGCNIHDAMIAYVVVAESPFATLTDANGAAAISVPAGDYELVLWHPRGPGAGRSRRESVRIAPGQTELMLTLVVSPAPDRSHRHGGRY